MERVILTADEGMVLTNGTDYGAVIWLAEGANTEDYYPITRQEYEERLAEQAARMTAEVGGTWN